MEVPCKSKNNDECSEAGFTNGNPIENQENDKDPNSELQVLMSKTRLAPMLWMPFSVLC